MVNDSNITLLGVGNILLSDEGLGVHVVREMEQEYTFTPEINIVDGGTMGMELLSYMRGMTKLLLVDAVNGGEAPGTIYEFPHQQTEAYFTDNISVHEVGMQDILRIRALQENPLEDATVIGVEPESLDIRLTPTETVQAVLPEVKQRIIRQLEAWGINVTERTEVTKQ